MWLMLQGKLKVTLIIINVKYNVNLTHVTNVMCYQIWLMLQGKLKVLQRGGREGREGLKVLECSRMEENHLAYDRIVKDRWFLTDLQFRRF